MTHKATTLMLVKFPRNNHCFLETVTNIYDAAWWIIIDFQSNTKMGITLYNRGHEKVVY